MKQRFSSLDVKVISQELASELVNLRVSNIYDLSSRIFLFKLAKPDHRKQFIVDSGFRCHVTQYSRATATAPSQFVSRLRKFLKSRRITSIKQIGTDRVIDISFSDDTYHMFLEFFAGGNIIVTDREYNMLAVFRQVSASEGEEARVGLKYTVTNKQNYNGVPPITMDRIRDTVEKAKALFAREDGAPKKSKKKNADVLRKALSQGFPEYPPLLLDHAFAVREIDPATPLDQVLQDEDLLQKVEGVLREAEGETVRLSTQQNHPGYIVAQLDARSQTQQGTGEGETPSDKPSLLYEDFHPFKPRQFEKKPGVTILEFPSLNATVDEYFSSIETQKLESRLTEREETARRKLEAVRQEHEKRIGALKETQELHIRKAGAIEDNVYRVQEAMDAVNGLIAQGMDWVEIARLIEMEQGRGNPVAQIIKLPLKLYENTITLLLGEAGEEQEEENGLFSSDESESESDEEHAEAQTARSTPEQLTIDIDLGLSPWANATQYYDQKKMAAIKEQRTTQSSEKALKSHEKKVNQDLKKGLKQEKQVLHMARKPFWFEKFLFFISSEGYLVLGGRDAMQSEILYRRHLKKGDIFVNADLDGARPMIVKNRSTASNSPIPPSTLSQAGNLCVATSNAWESKAVMSAYWAHASQVTKTAEAGGLLPTGEFLVKGEKNFLAPSQLVLGFAVMFQVSKESLRNHKLAIFDEPASAESAAGGNEETQVAEEAQQTEQTQPAEEVRPTETSNEPEKEPEEDQSSEEEEEPENNDNVPARNPLQRGPSESPVENTAEEADGAELDDDNDLKATEDQDELAETGEGEEEAEEEHTESMEAFNGGRSQDTKHLSARERRQLRQGKPIESAEPIPKKEKQPVTRGKKAKAKKAAAKYADQDDEERELALRLLGANKAKAEKAAAAAEAKEKRDREIEAQKKRRKAQHDRAAEAEKRRQAMFEEGAGDDYDEETAAAEAADLDWIPALVGTPHPDDEILAAIAVCAPWASLGRYKYKTKLQPGSVKKGKAVKEILGRWVSETTTGKVKKEHAEDAGISRVVAEKIRAREGELLKTWKDTEIINTIPVGKVRIMTGGSGSGGGDAKGKSKGGGGGGSKGGKGGKKK
ncbi:putative DUF814 domain protein [Aspergillus melleus]|uniref:putative DUF814 domain protein n=1 Tax=Aspergillus melleus TaxID=138277 RepID=UPI001E8DBB46|nr:uncharacterized protein LDX57_011762 [Aspergillus melleus]KAH8434124.1 hypothetical protein LDX57_011762 [Aspergillus melleus]